MQQLLGPGFRRYLDVTRRQAVFEEIGRKRAIVARREGDDLTIYGLGDDLSFPVHDKLRWALSRGPREMVRTWFHGEIAARGPKVFQPTAEQCFALEQIAPRIALADYAQPYAVMVIDLPQAYSRQRVCGHRSSLCVGNHTPEFAMIAQPPCEPPPLWIQVAFSSDTIWSMSTRAVDSTIEDAITREFDPSGYQAESMSEEERAVAIDVAHLAVNAMLLMMEYGCKSMGPANESHCRRLQHHLEVARKRGSGIVEAERELRLATQLYGLEQNIVLHEHERKDAGEGSDAEDQRRPHWRRGHWKMHAHGPGRALRKRILIKPVLVNGHLLNSDLAAVTYQVK